MPNTLHIVRPLRYEEDNARLTLLLHRCEYIHGERGYKARIAFAWAETLVA